MAYFHRLQKFNPNHHPAGTTGGKGGQFAPSPGGVAQDAETADVSEVDPPDAPKVDDGRAYLEANVDKMTPEEIMRSPLMIKAQKEMDDIPLTSERPDYGTPDYRRNRVFDFKGEKVVGYREAIGRLFAQAVAYAGMKEPNRERQAFIVIGPPAAGKSTIAETLAKQVGGMIADPDDAKKVLPEFNGKDGKKPGIGANAVHEESSDVNQFVFNAGLMQGYNQVIPKVGHNEEGIRKLAKELTERWGYKVHLINMKVAPEEAFRRMTKRFLSTGRLIKPSYIHNVVRDRPSKTYQTVKNDQNISSYAELDGHTPFGTPPRLIDGTGVAAAFYSSHKG